MTGSMAPKMEGPKPRPASNAIKNVDVANPDRSGVVSLIAIACAPVGSAPFPLLLLKFPFQTRRS
jgi:hypothetical protein